MLKFSRAPSLCAFLCALLLLSLFLATPATSNEIKKTTEIKKTALQQPLAIKSLLLDIAAYEQRLIAVGERGHILYSHDSGNSWHQANVPTRRQLNTAHIINENEMWAAGQSQMLLKSIDGGKNWTLEMESNSEDLPFLDLWFDDTGIGIAVGAYGLYYRTSDAGKTWSEMNLYKDDDFHLNAIARANNGDLFIAAEAGSIYRSADKGLTWTFINSDYQGSFFKVLPLEARTKAETIIKAETRTKVETEAKTGSLIFLGLRGTVLMTDDYGASWRKPPKPFGASLFGGILIEEEPLLVGNSGQIMHLDQNLTMKDTYHQDDRQALVSAALSDQQELFIVGQKGLLRFSKEMKPKSFEFKPYAF